MLKTRCIAVFGSLLTCLVFSTCGSEELSQATCAEDYDCLAGEVCEAATDGESKTCVAAAPGQERTFGEASLDFTDADATYLLSVASIPTGAAAISSSEIFYALVAPATSAAASVRLLRPRAKTSTGAPLSAQAAFDAARYARTVAMLDASAEKPKAALRPRLAAAVCGECGDSLMCWQGACTDAPTIKFTDSATAISGTLEGVLTVGASKINVVVDSSLEIPVRESALEAAERFAAVFETELSLLGLDSHTGAVDRDGEGRLTLVFTNRTTSGAGNDILGFFDNRDFFDASETGATGNVADILWARAPSPSRSIDKIAGTLAHEYQHLASYAIRVQARLPEGRPEVLWLDEGLSHLMEDLTGFGSASIRNIEAALESWNEAPLAKSLPATSDEDNQQRGKAFMLLRHMAEQRGAGGATSIYTTLLNEEATGFEHPMFQQGISDTLARFQLGVFATNNAEVTQSAAHAYDYQATYESSVTDQIIGIDPRGEYLDTEGDDVMLDGPVVTEASPDDSELTDASIKESGTQLFVVTGDSGTVVLRGTADADADLRLSVTRIK